MQRLGIYEKTPSKAKDKEKAAIIDVTYLEKNILNWNNEEKISKQCLKKIKNIWDKK